MDGVSKLGENGKISNLLDLDAEKKPLDESRKTDQTSGTKIAFYYFLCSPFLPDRNGL
ncbi:hypothetical protein Hanom_Chr06g00508881 [Helianthus anomalus]